MARPIMKRAARVPISDSVTPKNTSSQAPTSRKSSSTSPCGTPSTSSVWIATSGCRIVAASSSAGSASREYHR